MSPERLGQVEELYHLARDRTSEERAQLLAQADLELRQEVESLLAQEGEFVLDRPALEVAARLLPESTFTRLTIGEKLGPYEIEAAVGAGGMGQVYKARDTRLGRAVAIKVSSQQFNARFEREARAISALNHPHICTLYDVGPDYLVMELVEGPTLAERLKQRALPIESVLRYGAQIANALAAAHAQGIIHRDLKPSNIMIAKSGVKVLDFGLAKSQQDDTMTSSHAVMGSPAYMAPEQREGKASDARTDIYALGLVLYEMATGQRPPQDQPALPYNLLDGLAHVIQRCLDKDPEQRWQSARDIKAELEWLGRPKSPALATTPLVNHRGKGIWIAATTIMSLITGLFAFAYFTQKGPDAASRFSFLPHEAAPERPHVKFQINPPDALGGFKLSPNGRFLAFVTGLGSTGRRIWIKSLDGLDTQKLIDLYGFLPFSFFWSRDSEHIAFQHADKLYNIARNGGPAVVLTDTPEPILGGVWLDSGVILFSTRSGLFRVASSGGAPVKIENQSAELLACLSGKRFLYMRANEIFAGSLDGGKPDRILSDGSVPTYVPPPKRGVLGHLLFVRGKTLLAQKFDAEKLEVRGDAIPIVERVGLRGSTRPFTASENGVLVFSPGTSQEVTLTWLDRAGKRLQSVGKPFSPDENEAIRLSPNDSQAIVPIAGAKETDLWIADLNRDTLSRFTFNGSYSGIWSPDGHKVLWAANDGNRYLRSADGSGKDEPLFKNPNCETCNVDDWSSDGKFVVFPAKGEKAALDIWLVTTDGDRKPYPFVQSHFATYWSQISPDNRWMAYGADQSPLPQQIFVESIPAGKGRWQISTEGGDWAIWRRDGKELFYRQGTKLMAVPIHLMKTSVEIGKPQALFEVPEDARFQVSRDGQRFLIALPIENTFASPLTVDSDWRAGLVK